MTNFHRLFFREKVLINFMRLTFVILLFGIVCAQDGWEDIKIGVDGSSKSVSKDSSDNDTENEEVVADVEVKSKGRETGEDGRFYTSDFYLALGISALVLAVLGIFIWFWLRGSKNKWDN